MRREYLFVVPKGAILAVLSGEKKHARGTRNLEY